MYVRIFKSIYKVFQVFEEEEKIKGAYLSQTSTQAVNMFNLQLYNYERNYFFTFIRI